jgi:FKBP-type peptidyl-prolyl cis-trans isomerase FkpA
MMKIHRPRSGFLLAALLLVGVGAAASILSAKTEAPQVIPPKQRVCTAKTTTGLGFKMLRSGTGAMPMGADYVEVGYIGYFAKTGAVFDQSESATFPVGGVVPGFSEGLKLMKQGGIHRLCLPSRLGYGTSGAGPIPPNSDLVFQVRLIKVMTKAQAQAAKDAAQQEQVPQEGE